MSEQLRESLSAAMDNEADAFELRRVLDEATVDDELREQWHRFHLVRDVLRDDVANYEPELRERIRAALNAPEQEDEADSSLVLAEAEGAASSARNPWWGRMTGAAVAATVAAVVVLNGPTFDDAANQPAQAVLVDNTPANLTPANLTPVMHREIQPEDRERQNGFMLHHYQHQAINTPGVQSFVKLATFQSASQATSATSQDRPRPVDGESTAP